MLKHNKHFNVHLQSAYNKYGANNFEMSILEICFDVLQISILEEQYIAYYKEQYNCYNILSGGPTMSNENNPFFGKTHTVESRMKLSENRKGKRVGEKNNFYGANHSGENNGFYGHKHTEESRRKMSESKSILYKGEGNPFYGKKHTAETREKMKDNWKNSARKVMCVETGIIYDSISKAAKETNSSAKQISAVCCGHYKTANGLHWKHMSDRGKPMYGG